jgi:hypothetical protein
MIFDLKNLQIEVIKKFDSKNNFFNPTCYPFFEDYKSIKPYILFRKESKFQDKVLVSDIVDQYDFIILKSYIQNDILYSFEDVRFINKNELSVCVCQRDLNDLGKIIKVNFAKYNLKTRQLIFLKTQNAHFEKHWQFYNDKIIYHINPYTIFDNNENVIFKKQLNWQPWIERYGNPGLSTNVFEVDGLKYLLFHSYIPIGRLYYKYFVGLLRLNDDLSPLGYTIDPLFEASREYSDNILLNDLWNWRKTELCETVKYEVIFPMNVIVDSTNLNIYSGLNDCSAVNLKIDKQQFEEKIRDQPFILI